VVVRTSHNLDVSDCVVVEQISVHVAVVLQITSEQLAHGRCMHVLGCE
jgi:hypothetical protein